MLSSQIATAIENAALYESMEEKVEQRTRELAQRNERIRQQAKLLENAMGDLRLQKEDIEASINYAKRIQEALLPARDEISTAFRDSFIFFKPRDVVSGDFYWYANYQGIKIIAAVDCTGHGVPGAFMSLIGITFLSQIVEGEGITTPGKILHQLDKSIQQSLAQETGSSQDGMDAALCTFHKDGVLFSGAHNPLYYFTDNQEELQIVKGVAFGLGGRSHPKKKFETHHIPTMGLKALYIFSDGYQDQFGGPKGRKFLRKNFKRLLTEVHNLPAAQQEAILESRLQAWMREGKERQIDDVLVIGLIP